MRIVCVFSVLCAAALEAAPTVTYDQRQQGEFNLQVDLDDVAIVLLPGGEFRQKSVLADRMVHQIFGRRRNGAAGSPKKKHKPAANCGATAPNAVVTTTKPAEVPDNGYGETSAYPADRPNTGNNVPAPVSEINEPAGLDGEKILSYYDPYSVTPSTPDIFNKNVFQANAAAEDSAGMVLTPAAGAAGETVTELTEMVAVKTVDKPAASATDPMTSSAAAAVSDGNTPAAADETNFDEKLVSVPADVKTVEKISHAHETVKTGEMPTNEDSESSNEMSAVPIADKPSVQEAENSAKVSAVDDAKPEDDNKSVEMVAMKTVDKPTTTAADAIAAESVGKSAANILPVQDATEMNGPVQMVAMKTMEKPTSSETLKFAKKPVDAVPEVAGVPAMTPIDSSKNPTEMVAVKAAEKPTFAEALKAAKKPVDAGAVQNAAVPEMGVSAATTSLESSKTPIEIVTLKTAENPSNVWSANSIEKSEGITTSTKLVEIQEEKRTPNDPAAVETVVSRAAPKLTEMVAVKTMENPATVTTVKSVTSVKTVIKSGTPKTTLSSNGSSILRKVGDRKPLPSITMEIAPPKVI